VTPSDSPSAASQSLPVLAEGQKLAGCYLLRKSVDTAGTGTVWLAHDEVLGRDISLHFLPPQVRADERAMEEIRKEVKKNRQLIHPNILRVHDLIEEPEFAAISMDAFSGESLAGLLRQKGSLEPAAIQPWIGAVCQTLEDAHKVNLTHRDLAPANIFLGADGKVLLASFGISRGVQDELGRVARGANPRLSYLSPQLADGQPAARTDDVYSLGMLLFELLTGELPFNGGDVLSQIKRVAAPRVSARLAAGRRAAEIPSTWDETIAAALRKDATQRPPTALEFATRLQPVVAKTAAPAAVEVAAAKVAETVKRVGLAIAKEKELETRKADAPATAAPEPATSATPAGIAPTEPPPRKAVEILRERAAELARTKAGGGTPAPVPAADTKMPTPPLAPSDPKTLSSPAKKEGATEIYPSLYPKRSRGPALALAAGVAIAAIAGAGYFLQNTDEAGVEDGEEVEIATTDGAYASEIRSVNHKTELPAPPAATPAPVTRAVAPAKAPEPPAERPNPPRIAVVAPKPEPSAALATPAPQPAPPLAKPAPVPAPPAPVAEVPPTPAPVAPVPPTTAPATPAPMLMAANSPDSRKQERAVNAKPATPESTMPPTTEAIAEKAAAVEKLKEALQTSDQAHQGLLKQQEQMDAAIADIQKQIELKTKEMGPLQKSTADLQKSRKQREDAHKAAELEAQKAQQLAAEKARLADEAKKALADLEVQNQEKLAAQQKADTEIADLRKALTEKQQAAAAAAKAASDAKLARLQQQAAVEAAEREVEQTKLAVAKSMAAETARKAREEAEKLVAEKAQERQRIETEIAAMKKMFEEKMKVLEDAQKAMTDAEAKTKDTEAMQKKAEEEALKLLNKPAAAGSSKPAAPEKPATPEKAPAPATPAPTGALVPSDNPLAQAAATPAATLAMKTEPPKPLTAKSETPAPKPVQGANLGENSLGMKFVPVGDAQFAIWQTRVKDFEVFAKAVDLRSNAWKGPGFKQAPDHPVVNVTWHEAVAFCKWLTDKERKDGILPANQLYRLPTDLEWSKAVGLGEETGRNPEARDMGVPDVYPWGTQWPPPASAGNYTGEETGSDVAIKGYDDGFAWTSPVGSFPPNQFGLYDMGGNVWQWVMDSWNSESKHKVLRGASWYNGALKLSLLSSCRVHAAADSSTDNYGFRIVRAGDSGKSSK
jgi:serine/threonine protein kinase/formylglycine-generating enzyme required for sulfatase activity